MKKINIAEADVVTVAAWLHEHSSDIPSVSDYRPLLLRLSILFFRLTEITKKWCVLA